MRKAFRLVVILGASAMLFACSANTTPLPAAGSGGGLINNLVPEVHSTEPESPSTNLNPSVIGKARASSTVTLYSDSACATLIATGTADANGNYSIPIAVGANSTTSIYAKATTSSSTSSCSTTTVTYVQDATGPAIAITSPAANTRAQTGLTMSGTCETGLTIALSGAGLLSPASTTCTAGAFSVAITFTAGQGNKNIVVTQVDASLNVSSDNRTFVRDNTSPVITVTSHANMASVPNPVTLAGACETGLTINLSGTGLVSPTTTTCTASAYSVAVTLTAGNGNKALIFQQTDAANNTGTLNRTFVADGTPPVLNFSTPADNSYTMVDTFVIAGVCETGLTVNLSGAGLSSPATTVCAGSAFSQSITVTAGDGSKVISIMQTDTAGNSTTATRTFILDTVKPVTPAITSVNPVSPSSVSTPLLSGLAEASSTVSFYSDSGCTVLIDTTTANGAGTFSHATAAATNTLTTFYANSTDAALNISDCTSSATNYQHYNIGTGLGYFYGASSTNAPGTPTNINQGTAYSVVFPSSRFDNNYFSHNRVSNSHLVTAKVAGNYLLTINLPINATLTNGAVKSEIYVNGSLYTGTLAASSYISNASAHSESSLHLTRLIRNINVNDQIEVRVMQSGSAGTISLSEGNLYLEYMGVGRVLFSATATDTDDAVTPSNLNQATAYSLKWTEEYKSAGYTHSDVTNPQNITLSTTASYVVSVNVPVTSAVINTNVRVLVQVNGVTITNGQAKQGVIRNVGGHNVSSIHFNGLAYNVTAGSVLTVKVQQEANTGTVTVPIAKPATILVERLDSTSKVYAATSTSLSSGTNWAPTPAVFPRWSVDNLIDTGVYTHSTATNSHQITVLETGDYLLYYNDAVSAAGAAVNSKVTVQVNAVSQLGAETKTHYISNANSHTESSGTMVFFLRNLSANDVIQISTVREAAAVTSAASPGATIYIHKKD